MSEKTEKTKTGSAKRSAASKKEGRGAAKDDVDVNFLYKTMLQRDPSKRRVKPVENHLLQIHFGMSDDESSDSDYEFKPGAGSDDDIGSDEMDGVELTDDKDDKGEKQSGSDGSGSDSDASSDEDSDSDIEESEDEDDEVPVIEKTPAQHPKSCCVCLSSTCEEDEIIECDGCGILVHEGCYGTVEDDAISVHSNMSTESTEPWFCDPCKAGVTPSCELCPNQFGIFKQTDTGRWVHLICALYVPAVAFGNTEKLTNVTLLEMPYTKWGSKECSLCDDDNYRYTGVCIGCDAGMCRSYFHVTCAHRYGLLSEASIDEEIADPFYAHCKMHGDKLVSKQKKRNFLALSGHTKQFRGTKHLRPVSARTKKRLEHFKKKFQDAEARRPPAWVPPNKLPRALSSSASAIRSLMRKAELLGVTTGAKVTEEKAVLVKKSYVAPALTVEFAAYYEQRKAKFEAMEKQNKEALKQNTELQEQQTKLDEQIAKLKATIKELHKTHEDARAEGYELFRSLEIISKEKIKMPAKFEQPAHLKSPLSAAGVKRRISSCAICESSKDQHLQALCDQCHNHYHLSCLDPPLTRMPKKSKSCLWVCSICDHKNSQSPVETDDKVNTEAPRRLRQCTKEPEKFLPPELQFYVDRMNPVGRPRKRGVGRPPGTGRKRGPGRPRGGGAKRGRKPKHPSISEPGGDIADDVEHSAYREDNSSSDEDIDISDELETSRTPDSAASTSPAKVGRKPKMLETGICKPCQSGCHGGNSVRCDECMMWYHFTCLEPPVKKSPKHRGYQWYCEECERSMEIMDTEGGEEVTMEISQGDDKIVSFSGDVVDL